MKPIGARQQEAIEVLVQAGYDAESVVTAVLRNDPSLMWHTGKTDRKLGDKG